MRSTSASVSGQVKWIRALGGTDYAPDGTPLGPGLPAVPTTASTTGASFDWSLTALAAARTGGLTTFTGDLLTRAGTFVTGTIYRGAWDPAGTKWWEGWTAYNRN